MAERLLSLELKMCFKKVNYVLSGKVIITRLIAGQMKKVSLYKMIHFVELYTHRIKEIKVKLNLPNYATKPDSEVPRDIQSSDFAKNTGLADLKSKLSKLDNDKFSTALTDLNKSGNVANE